MKLTKKQRQIMEQSINLFGEKGYAETSIRDIAESVNIKTASLYAHIKSKEEILIWICDDLQYRFQVILHDINTSNDNNCEKFITFVRRHLEEVLKNLNQQRVFLHYWKIADKEKDGIYTKTYDEYISFAVSLVNKIKKNNDDQKCFHSNTTALILLQILNHIPNWVRDKNVDINVLVSEILNKFFNGFGEKNNTK